MYVKLTDAATRQPVWYNMDKVTYFLFDTYDGQPCTRLFWSDHECDGYVAETCMDILRLMFDHRSIKNTTWGPEQPNE